MKQHICECFASQFKMLRVAAAMVVSTIATFDFPHEWPTAFDDFQVGREREREKERECEKCEERKESKRVLKIELKRKGEKNVR